MKLETSEGEREGWKSFYHSGFDFIRRLLRDIDTLLAEVERLRAERRPFSDGLAQKVIDEQVKAIDRLTAKLAAEPPAPPLPAEVEEMRKTLDYWGGLAGLCGMNQLTVVLRSAASLLSRWPGVWRPIETAPKDKHILVWAPSAHGLSAMFSVCLWHPDGGFCIDELRDPTHWSPLPEPPHEK